MDNKFDRLQKYIPFSNNIFLSNIFLVFVLTLILFTPISQQVNARVLDRFVASTNAHNDIVLITIDEQTISRLGTIDSDVLTQTIEILNNKDPKVVGVHYAPLAQTDWDSSIFDTSYPLVIAEDTRDETDKPRYITSGFTQLDKDFDGKVRNTTLSKHVHGECTPSFAIALLSEYTKTSFPKLCQKDIELRSYSAIPNDLYFSYAQDGFTEYSLTDLLYNKITRNQLHDKIVIIGGSVKMIESSGSAYTNIQGISTSSLKIHANIINSILKEKYRGPLSFYVFMGSTLLVSFALTKLLSHIEHRNNRLPAFLLIVLLINTFGFIIYDQGIIWPFLQINIICLFNYAFYYFYAYVFTQKENASILTKAFSRYINPKLLPQIVKQPNSLSPGGNKRVMTVLFSDIRGFTSLSEHMGTEELIYMTNDYLELMSEVIHTHNGCIDKFIGDAIMAFWNAPQFDKYHQLNAIKTGLEMLEQLHIFNSSHTEYPDLAIGTGINTGEMVVGNIGGSRKVDYTVLGDNVNLASRLEGLTKKYGVPMIITESTLKGWYKQNDDIMIRLLDQVIVKGKSEPVKIYEPLLISPETHKLKQLYEYGFQFYQKGKFHDALQFFTRLKDDKPAQVMIKRMESTKNLEHWNGIWAWMEK